MTVCAVSLLLLCQETAVLFQQDTTAQQLAKIAWHLEEVNRNIVELASAMKHYEDEHSRDVRTVSTRLTETLVALQSQIDASNEIMQTLFQNLQNMQSGVGGAAREDARSNQFERNTIMLIVSALVTTVLGATAGAAAMRRAIAKRVTRS